MTPHRRLWSPWRAIGSAAAWPVTSQDRARRNALVASSRLAARRRERQEVEAFLVAHQARRTASGAGCDSPDL
jgi:hypothetical protein